MFWRIRLASRLKSCIVTTVISLTKMSSTPESFTVAQYLAENPNFFNQHAALLAELKLPSPVIGKAVSLQERQIEILREKYRKLELRMAELMGLAEENSAIVRKYKAWTKALLLAHHDVDLPYALTNGLCQCFDVPDATVRLWRVAEEHAHKWFAEDVGEDVRLFANSLFTPYCGPNRDFETANWLEQGGEVASVAILPLRNEDSSEVFGILIMGSSESERFVSGMATDFLVDIGDTASAALNCLLE